MDTTPPAPPPYGSLIERARKGARLSIQHAANAAGISKATWIDSARGYRKRGGAWERVTPKPETIARMANAVGLPPERLAGEGEHQDAAEVLSEILRDAPEPPRPVAAVPDARVPGVDDADAVIEALVRGDDVLERIWAFPDPKEPDGLLARKKRLDMIRAVMADGHPGRNRETGLDPPPGEEILSFTEVS